MKRDTLEPLRRIDSVRNEPDPLESGTPLIHCSMGDPEVLHCVTDPPDSTGTPEDGVVVPVSVWNTVQDLEDGTGLLHSHTDDERVEVGQRY